VTRINRISRALTVSDRRSVPAVIEASKGPRAAAAPAAPARPAPALSAFVPSVARETAAAGVALQLARGPERCGLKADPAERARYARAYRRAPALRGLAARVSA